MSLNVGQEVVALQQMTVRELRIRYAEVFGEETKAHNKTWLFKRIIWRMQSLAEGDLTERARKRAAELANDADVRLTLPRTSPADSTTEPQLAVTASIVIKQDDRIPPPGSVLKREYKGQTICVRVLPNGFDYDGQVYRSLSAVAKAVTGQHCNGFLFFHLNNKEKAK